MIASISTLAGYALFKLATKATKSFIDDKFRSKVVPVEGSVVYSDLFVGAEHSGIYVKNGQISNIIVTGTLESKVKIDSAFTFVDSSKLHSKIYVSCDSKGAVGSSIVADEAESRVGEKAFYGLVIKNCHEFSRNCVETAPELSNIGLLDKFKGFFELEETWEYTIGALKNSAKKHLGATKWRLWDQGKEDSLSESDLNNIYKQLEYTPLTPQTLEALKHSEIEIERYLDEIADEKLPKTALKYINQYKQQLNDISDTAQKAAPLLQQLGYSYTYSDLKTVTNIDFSFLAKELEANESIRDILNTLGRAYTTETKKLKQVNRANTNEVYGVHKSSDISRILPSELALLENSDLEPLFYAKLLESNLATYKMLGHHIDLEEEKQPEDIKGPIVACLDTSGSMLGQPILKARALLLAIHSIISQENRELYILLFGSNGQIKELHLDQTSATGLLPFICQEFSRGTDFETPLQRAVEIIECKKAFNKADILMITDGGCSLSANFKATLKTKKRQLDCTVQTVICNGYFVTSHLSEDGFSDQIINI